MEPGTFLYTLAVLGFLFAPLEQGIPRAAPQLHIIRHTHTKRTLILSLAGALLAGYIGFQLLKRR